MAKRPSLRGAYDPKLEAEQYDVDYYNNHTKYYDRGIPHFIQFLKENFKFESIADIGCGTGAFIAPLQEEKKIYGFDFSIGAKDTNVQQLKPENFYVVDLATPNATAVAKGVDVAVSLETYEHIYPAFETIYLDNVFSLDAKYVILSCAAPGQIGRRHVNCKTIDDVKRCVQERYPQYVVDTELTEKFKSIKYLASFYKRNTVIFRRLELQDLGAEMAEVLQLPDSQTVSDAGHSTYSEERQPARVGDVLDI